MEYKHIPVMLEEAIENLNIKLGGFYVDCTLGGAGYTTRIASLVGSKGRVLATDLDSLAIKNAEARLKKEKLKNVIIVKDNFRNLAKILDENTEFKNKKIDGIVFDLGLSSAQLDDRNRGISFKYDTPLDMAFETTDDGEMNKRTSRIVNKWRIEHIEKILKDYGEEPFARRIAKLITMARRKKPIETTGQLVEIIKKAIPPKLQNAKIHFATRTFQALRIATNEELESLTEVLPQAIEALAEGGRCVVISYHSLEDRIVKDYFKQESQDCICDSKQMMCSCNHEKKIKIINKKVIPPTEAEIKNNPRARSAKMRVIEKI
ncbi:16S rRNA (cytosine(1402)-N(4))-methyltransferase RsmH [Candidatus Parcubacteria bacterium]|nr:16S rRNA (cytosine(1402)-N(4))-methyltransferase RsmH [Patescibacteria group bacterium]MBU4308976.1 16S rRNA (cytosine(1402)-N(4))-methyltransferase RsmH [Patescibacteria group bacterium]MBU4431709.1 16S rRNA (cytosine(1402)-N(4))-methyltransferase RsmH [Patescibacteria group bacterium]MBU4577336.1 16S rRNA (cytosine(1402)-N(4))-methyltransferase RsmH [Patescibacteria group bacterium]MCG2697024.1 16S rRNA (cytosine(1402)-N(4))-methyltransferase RsmH [Candidatus Parcubacteria bacterium]